MTDVAAIMVFVRVWSPPVETAIYVAAARIAARYLGRIVPVRSIYGRRSVACGEVVFGSSDIDLHVIIDPLPDLNAEAAFLNQFTDRYAALKRCIPCLGDCDVSTRAELDSWYASRPYTWYRDRAWLRLLGEEYDRPISGNGARQESLLWWFFWAWERLPDFYRAGNVRTCCNLLVDMLNAYGVFVGMFDAPMRRAEVLERWHCAAPSRERQKIWSAFRNGFRGVHRALRRSIYAESLKLCEALAAAGAPCLEGDVHECELLCQVPFGFANRRYLLVNPAHAEQVDRALDAMQRDATAFVTTTAALQLYLYHRNPWEYFGLRHCNASLELCAPPAAALRRAVTLSLNKERPRTVGLSVRRRPARSAAVGRQYAQCRLYVNGGTVATSAEDLRRQYAARYCGWPYTGTSSPAVYFRWDYRIACETIEEICQRLEHMPI